MPRKSVCFSVLKWLTASVTEEEIDEYHTRRGYLNN